MSRSSRSFRKILPGLIVLLVILYLGLHHHTKGVTGANTSANILPASSAPAGSMTLVTEPADGTAQVLAMIDGARKSVDIVMYELQDPQIEKAVIAARQRGVKVRVLLNGGYYGTPDKHQPNKPAYDAFQKYGVPVEYTPGKFALTHQKTLVVDGNQALVMTFNWQPQYYPTSRDFGVVDKDTADVTAIETVFNADWQNITLSQTPTGDDLLWSPGSEAASIALINQAKTSIKIYNEEMADSRIVSALGAAALRGVNVQIVMTDQKSWHKNFTILKTDGAAVHVFTGETPLYIHAKMILIDDSKVFLGSENFSLTSLQKNRELGVITGDKTIVASLNKTFDADFHSAPEY